MGTIECTKPPIIVSQVKPRGIRLESERSQDEAGNKLAWSHREALPPPPDALSESKLVKKHFTTSLYRGAVVR